MDPNEFCDIPLSWSDRDDEEDFQFMASAYEYHLQLEQEEGIEFQHPTRARSHIYREREIAEERLRNDYFVEGCKYSNRNFRRRFRMSRKLSLQIVEGIEFYTSDNIPDHFTFFRKTPDCTGRMSLSALMKCMSPVRQLAYGTSPDAFDEYLQMGVSTSKVCLDNFNKCIIDLFMPEYLRKPTWADVQKLYQQHEEKHGFPGMLGSIDCMHWEWKIFQWLGKGILLGVIKKYPTIMLEVVASQDLWISHAFFGMAGANNDINVLDNSPLFDDIFVDNAPKAPYMVNETRYEQGYYLANGIYPQWPTFVKSFTATTNEKHTYFKRRQESARKDIECVFGVLQGRWGILQQPARQWEIAMIRRIMYSCIILHNMIIKDQKFALRDYNELWVDPSANLRQRRWVERCDTHSRKAKEIHDRKTHTQLQQDLMEHVWQKNRERRGQQQESNDDK